MSDSQTKNPGPPIVDDQNAKAGDAKCPFTNGARKHTVAGTPTNASWWPDQLNLNILRQHPQLSNPLGEEFNYAEEFKSLDLNAVIHDLRTLMTSRGGLRTTATTGLSSFVWRGTAPAPIALPMGAAARVPERSGLLP